MRRAKLFGFTLIEVLVVMIIISIVGSAAILTISRNRNTQMEALAKQLANVITLAEEQALVQPAVLGLAFTQHTFQFYQFQENHKKDQSPWQPLTTDDVLGKQHFANDIQIILSVQGKVISPTEDSPQPHLIISSSGDITPFVILIGKIGGKPRYQVIGDDNGYIHYGVVEDAK